MSYGNRGNNRNRSGDQRGNSGYYDRPPRVMHDVTCSDCGKKTQVPFEPTQGRPVYCTECLPKHRAPKREF
ncbi:MAG: DNA-directed RNA polymerase [Nitrososphaerota archaeon]|nr:DNA-directed RNA polymerase [Nitrososphaerota archaeon]MDG6923529.1 DNA-directed RNA polymerase [Nitrososphaerota archaeon]